MLVSVVPESRDNEYVTITHILCQKIYILSIFNPELNDHHISFTSAKFMQPRSPLSGPILHNLLVKSRHIPFLDLGVLDLQKILVT